MAPIEPDLSNSNIRPAALLTGLAVLNITLTYIVAHRVLYRAYHALSPTLGTRGLQNRRRKHILAFEGLAFLSFSVALYFSFHLLGISYQLWAYERGEPVPSSLFRRGGLFARDHAVSLKLGRWLKDIDIVTEFIEATLDSSRRQWWTQQLLLGGTIWSIYVAFEGRRRNIPHLWAFVALSITMSLSFAQNLFFLAVLLSPVPLSSHDKHGDLVHTPQSAGKHARKPSKAALAAAAKAESTMTSLSRRVRTAFEARFPPKPAEWSPKPWLFTLVVAGSILNAVLIAFAANTPSFMTFLWLHGLSLFLPLIFLRLAPLSWGSTSRASSRLPHDAFKVVGILGTLIYSIRTAVAILDNTPQPPNRYYILPQHRSKAERLAHPATAISRVLASLGDNPAMSRVGWDVLLSGLSLIVWAGVRGLSASHMLRATGWATKGELELVGEVKDLVTSEVSQLIGNSEEPTTPKKGGRARKSSSAAHKDDDDNDEDGAEEEPHSSTTPKRSSAIQRWRGEELKEEDWEAGALGWGMMVLGGLGVASAAVLGSELI